MQMESLTIGLKSAYSKPSPTNTYEAKIQVSYNDTRMQVKLSEVACQRILALAADEIAAAAQIQISDFVNRAMAIDTAPMIEAALDHAEEGMPF